MNRTQKALIAVVSLQLVCLGVFRNILADSPSLPIPALSHLVPTTANEIRRLQEYVDPSDPSDWLDLAKQYMSIGLLPEADYCFRQVSRLNPSEHDHLFDWGVCLGRLGLISEARERYRDAIAAHDRDSEKMGGILLATSSYTALACATCGCRLPTGEAGESWEDQKKRQRREHDLDVIQDCLLKTGEDYLREDNLAAAESVLRKVTCSPWAKVFLCRAWIRTGRGEEALRLADAMVKVFPDTAGSVEYYQLKSQAAAAIGNTDESLRYAELSERSIDFIATHRTHGLNDELFLEKIASRGLFEESKFQEAEGTLDEACKLNAQALDLLWTEPHAQRQARLCLERGNPGDAIKWLADCIDRVGASIKTLGLLGEAWRQAGDEDKARQMWQRAVQIDDDAAVRAGLSESFESGSDGATARRHRALAHFCEGRDLWRRNALEESGAVLKEATELNPDYAPSWFYLGESRRHRGDLKGAKAAYARCIQINPDYARARRGLDRLRIADPVEFINSIGVKLMYIPNGSFLMGSPKNPGEARHRVNITKPFHLGAREITQRQYLAVVGDNPSAFTPQRNENVVYGIDTLDLPVESVSWEDADAFCRRLSAIPEEKEAGRTYRLPTEAEWEYACRAGSTAAFNFGDAAASRMANFNGNYPYGGAETGPYLKRPAPVGSYPPNAWGLDDMHGNVGEWCQDWHRMDYQNLRADDPICLDPQSARPYRINRGGHYEKNGWACRSAARWVSDPKGSDSTVGFRIVCEIR
jgi:formylglycine-generating enzyme required for sulfatase activity